MVPYTVVDVNFVCPGNPADEIAKKEKGFIMHCVAL
jgi:hypothetical protein